MRKGGTLGRAPPNETLTRSWICNHAANFSCEATASVMAQNVTDGITKPFWLLRTLRGKKSANRVNHYASPAVPTDPI